MAEKEKNNQILSCNEDSAIKCLGIFLGILVAIVGALCAIYELPQKLIDFKFKESISISPNSPVYSGWINPPVPIYMRFHIFNVTNRDEIIQGGTPRVKECGPYTYRMYAPKFNVTFYPNDTVSFYNNYTLHFQPNMSKGREDDVLFHLNVPLSTLGIMTKKASIFDYFGLVNRMVESSGGSDLFPSHTAHELLFGYRDPIFAMLNRWSMFIGHVDPNFGFFHKFNNSDDGTYLMNTGRNHEKAHSIAKWNGKEYLNFWSTKYANMINGSDGSFMGTNLTPEDTPYLYFPQMCRSMKLEFERKSKIKDIDTLKFHLSEDFMANSSVNPDNAGFCVPTGNCYNFGVLNVQSCMEGAPGFLSLPHFYNAAKEYQNAVLGLTPDKEKHDSVYYVEPRSGAVLRSHRQLQINILLQPSTHIESLKNVKETIFPVLWLGGSAEIYEEAANSLKMAISLSNNLWISSYFIISVGCLILVISLCCFSKPNQRAKLLSYFSCPNKIGRRTKKIPPTKSNRTEKDETEI